MNKKEHKWIDTDNNNSEYPRGSVAESMFEAYIKACKEISIEPTCDLNIIQEIVTELEDCHASLKERAEMFDENNPIVRYTLEEDERGDLVVLEARFGKEGQFDVALSVMADEVNND